ncbi:uncharacterized protein LOC142635467 [Castanea sativa]|uniref:uncharacterized protein LOC142635467 n=1 Tax=Castanea sativa TaxID=21020 RepID=UPI003F64B2B7
MGGGLALFWKKDVVVDIESSSLNHIDVLINKGKDDEWRFIGFYGAPKTQSRVESWDLIRNLHTRFSVPWLCADAFNEITKTSEKMGGRLHPYWQMQNFCQALDECGLMDLVKVNKPWRFEQIWLEDDGCHDTVAVAWSEGGGDMPMAKVVKKVERCQEKLKKWSKFCFSNVTWEISKKKKQMVKEEEAAINGGDGAALVKLKQELVGLLVKEEKLFVGRFLQGAFYNLKPVQHGGSNSTHTSSVVTEEMNRELVREFSHAEVDMALNHMAPLKAPSLEGMPPLFYQHYWQSIREEVSEAVLDCLNTGKIPPGLNQTFLTLIPKVKSPEKADKAISDYILVAFETLHHMQTKKSGKNGYMTMKLDISKAYDRVEDIDMLIRKFWWRQRGERRKIHWKNWETLCKPKKEDGLGFKELAKFNDAMLAKQSSGLYAWKSILKSRKVISMGAKWRVGDGLSISVFKDNWILDASGGRVIDSVLGVDENLKVADLIDVNLGCWKNQVIEAYSMPFDAKRIEAIPLGEIPQPNLL